jgi:uncharacterized damage-inducible protein DinB
MKKTALFTCIILMCVVGVAPAQTPAPAAKAAAAPVTLSDLIHRTLNNVQKEFVDAADAMPADKYDFAPTNGDFKGVRTFGEQVKHVAGTNWLLAAGLSGDKIPDEDANKGLKTKDEIMKDLRASFDALHKAFNNVNQQNCMDEVQHPFAPTRKTSKLNLVLIATSHPFDHYGQMVEYLRMNSIIPPASRK